MELKVIDKAFSVCKVTSLQQVDLEDEYVFIGKTSEEISVVCETQKVPQKVEGVEHGWCALKIQGILDFSLIGILAPIATLLAEAEIGIFVVSTFNTDYILIKQEQLDKAKEVLTQNQYTIF